MAQATGDTGKNDAADLEALYQRSRSGCSSHLANARQYQHHRLAVQLAVPEIAPGMNCFLGLVQQVDQALLLFLQGAEDGSDGVCGRHERILPLPAIKTENPVAKKKAACAAFVRKPLRAPLNRDDYFLSRNSRRKILPTGVLGRSVRNSTTLGCL